MPPYAPELNPVEYLWAHWKQHEMPNFCPKDFAELSAFARAKLKRTQRRKLLVAAFWKQRCPRGERLIDHVPHGHWKTITFVAGLRRRAMVAPLVGKFVSPGAFQSHWIRSCHATWVRAHGSTVI